MIVARMSPSLGRASLAAVAGVVALLCAAGAGHGSTRVRLAPCSFDATWLCGQLRVPLDRARPNDGAIPIAFYVLRHRSAKTGTRPVFVTPGGPGLSGWGDHAFYEGTALAADRDIVLIDPRGSGRSGAIDCTDLQDGWHGMAEFRVAVAACGKQLGAASDRYDSGDVAMDVDAVRQALGYDTIDYFAFSYGSVAEQAYAARFPQHLHALAIDAGVPATDPGHAWTWSLGVPHALDRIGALVCKREHCTGDVPAAIAYLAVRVRARSLVAQLGATRLVVDEPELINILRFGGDQDRMLDPQTIVGTAAGLRHGNTDLLRNLALAHPYCCGSNGNPEDFSQGDNLAAFCSDMDFVWNRSDAIPIRVLKFNAAVAALPRDAASPFSIAGWNAFNQTDQCVNWPAPRRFEPAVPANAKLGKIPTIIFSGDVDATVPTEITRTLLTEFPKATFVTVAGAAHPTIGWRRDCVPGIVGHFFDTRTAGDIRCAARPQ
jgi:pimeloyl-ACP methyl ester carboxylesterase